MNLIWVTDPHFNMLAPGGAQQFGTGLHGDAVVVTGDIGESPSFAGYLQELAKGFGGPVYYVLGNHDYYRGTIERTETIAKNLHGGDLHWLRIEDIVLNKDTVLVGTAGWYDCRLGDPSRLDMSDFIQILDFFGKSRDEIIRTSEFLAELHANELRGRLEDNSKKYSKVIIACHIPPFPNTRDRDMAWDPWFTSMALGNMLAEVAEDYPEVNYTVLCGHRHRAYTYQHGHNLRIWCGEAEYGAPGVSGILDI